MTNATDTATKIHPFEAAGLGYAPFRFVGMDRKVGPIDLGGGRFAGAPGQPMGTCDFCGTGIADCCIIADSKGKTFIVGTTCVEKTHSKGVKLLNDVQHAVKEMKRKAKAEKDTARIDATRQLLTLGSVQAALSSRKHPNEYRAGKGDTMLDWATWMLANAGTTGRLEVCKVIERIN